MNQKIGVVDYESGNICSVENAIVKLGKDFSLVGNPDMVASFDKIILPGVGSFPKAMMKLNESGMTNALNEHVNSGKAILGICLGMQLMCNSSLEDEYSLGLSWIDANVIPFIPTNVLKVPHVGWNAIRSAKQNIILDGFKNNSDVYFVHSYYVSCNNQSDVLLTCDYGGDFVAGFSRGNIFGLQFHPEKSQLTGLGILSNFLNI
jgi:imidazole glycerol-phosphate synthase subunit HisH